MYNAFEELPAGYLDPVVSEIAPVKQKPISTLKRKAVPDDEESMRDGESSYDATPKTSPVLDSDATMPSIRAEGGEDVRSVQSMNGAPKRAPRKKRKWLKRGEGE